MSITADKPILSYNDHEEATITAKLSEGTTGISGETLSYEILDKNDNVLDSGSDVTDEDGEISFTYQSTGIGNVQVIVYYGMFLQETYTIIDATFKDIAVTGQKNTNWQLIRLDNPVTDENGTLLTANSNYAHYLVINSTQRFSVPFAVEFVSNFSLKNIRFKHYLIFL